MSSEAASQSAKDVRTFHNSFHQAIVESYADGDTFPLATFFAPDAALFGWAGNAFGHQQIIDYYASGIRRVRDQVPGLKKIDVETTQLECHVSDDQVHSWIYGLQTIDYQGASETLSVSSRFTYALHRDTSCNEWKIKHAHTSQARGMNSLPEGVDVTFNV